MIGFLLLHCWYKFLCVSMFVAPTFVPNIAKHGPRPPIKPMQTICQDLPTIGQQSDNISKEWLENKMCAYITPHRNHRPFNRDGDDYR